jgi:hypothetical protein
MFTVKIRVLVGTLPADIASLCELQVIFAALAVKAAAEDDRRAGL